MSKCTIKDGKYFAPNGEESLLYRNLRENMSEDEANDLFVLSKTPSFQENVINPLIESHRNKTLEIPANIKFKETFANKIRTFHIYSGKTKVGRIQMTPYKDGFKVKSSLVNEDQRGKGFGKYLYNYTISKLLVENSVLYTDTARTEAADRVWESLKKQGLSQDGKSVKPLPKEFDKNGEIGMSTVLQYTADNFSQTLPLNAVEKSHLINLQIEGVETSDDLYNVLYDAFYKNNLFSPNINKLKKIYSEDEIRNILEDSEIQGRVKETIEKLRQTEEFTIPQIKYNKDFDVRSSKVNIIGQYKKQNPLKLEQQVKEQDYVKVPVVNEAGEQLETQLFYENAIKAPSDKSIRALQAIVGAHPMVDTTKLENKLIKTFKNYGMDIEGIERENFKELLDYVTEPTDENRKALEDVLGFVREPLTKPINISPENRSYQYLKTAKSEQELFDEMSLIQTTTPNVYHKVNKIDKQEIRDIQENQDLTVPDYQLYKDYYGYNVIDVKKEQLQIINSSNPAPNNYNTWIRSVEDIKIAEDVFKTAFEEGAMYPDFTESDMKKVLQSGKVTIHSSYPIKEGVFVTPSKMNAQEYAGGKNGKIYTKEVNVNDIAWIDESEGQYAPISYKKEFVKPIQTNIQTDTNYLLNSFIADFAAEKLKTPTEFNRQFKITETGIELASNDIITLETIKAYIQDGTKYSKEIADYSLISKDMPNLKEKDSFTVESVEDKRIKAVNDINSVNKLTTEITIINEESFSAPNETNQFLRIGNEIYEQQEQGYYNKLQKNTNPNFFDLNPQQPEFKNFDIQQEKSSENNPKKLTDKDTDSENFSCLS